MEFSRREWIAGSAALAGLAATPLKAAPAPYELPIGMVHPELRPMVKDIMKFTCWSSGDDAGFGAGQPQCARTIQSVLASTRR